MLLGRVRLFHGSSSRGMRFRRQQTKKGLSNDETRLARIRRESNANAISAKLRALDRVDLFNTRISTYQNIRLEIIHIEACFQT